MNIVPIKTHASHNLGISFYDGTPSPAIMDLARRACKATNLNHPESVLEVAKVLASHKPGTMSLVVKRTNGGKSGCYRAVIWALPELLMCTTVGTLLLTNISHTSLFVQQNDGMNEGSGFKTPPKNYSIPVRTTNNKSSIVASVMMSGGAVRQEGADDFDNNIIKSRLIKAQKILAKEFGCQRIVIIIDEVHVAVGHGSQVDRLKAKLNALIKDIHGLQWHYALFGFTATPSLFFDGDIENALPLSIVTLPCDPKVYTSAE